VPSGPTGGGCEGIETWNGTLIGENAVATGLCVGVFSEAFNVRTVVPRNLVRVIADECPPLRDEPGSSWRGDEDVRTQSSFPNDCLLEAGHIENNAVRVTAGGAFINVIVLESDAVLIPSLLTGPWGTDTLAAREIELRIRTISPSQINGIWQAYGGSVDQMATGEFTLIH